MEAVARLDGMVVMLVINQCQDEGGRAGLPLTARRACHGYSTVAAVVNRSRESRQARVKVGQLESTKGGNAEPVALRACKEINRAG